MIFFIKITNLKETKIVHTCINTKPKYITKPILTMILHENSSFESWNFSTREVIKALFAEEYDSLIKIQNTHQYTKGQYIFQTGRTVDGVYLIENGTVKKYQEAGADKEQILYIATKGELLGYLLSYLIKDSQIQQLLWKTAK